MSDNLTVISPWSGERVLEVPLESPSAIEDKVAAARTAQVDWSRTSFETRLRVVERFASIALRDREAIARSVSSQMGKPIAEARGEVGTMVGRTRTVAALAPGALRDEPIAVGDGIRRRLVRDPLGVILDIAAWNYPLLIAGNVVVPGVLAGNAVLLKHASQTPAVATWFAEAFAEAGAPVELVQPVTVRGRDMRSLVQHRQVDGVFFTGSVPVGRQVARDVGAREHGFIDVGLELGGKDPAYVRADMPVELAAAALVEGAFYNAGQSCCAVERIYVHESLYPRFLDAYVAEAERWQVGDPSSDDTILGPLAAADALDTLEHQVAEAVSKGGRLLTGGKRLDRPGWCFPATVVADCDDSMELMAEESFGPVIGIAPVSSDEEALERMNASRFGLTASLWTADVGTGERLARRVSAGTVFVNRCDYVDPAMLWTGLRDSGKGVTLGRLGFDHLTRPRAIHARPLELMR